MSKRKKDTIIVGSCGQVGRALWFAMKGSYNLLEHDLRPKETKSGDKVEVQVDPTGNQNLVMNICIPYSKNFKEIVKEYAKVYSPELIVIHSTIEPGTTKALVKDGIPAVHSPVIFDDNYFKSIAYFRKMIGYDDDKLALMAEEFLRPCFNTALVKNSINTELSDLSLALYSMTCRAITFECSRVFFLLGCNYNVMMEFIKYNNIGYATLNKHDTMLQNMFPELLKEDYRVELLNLLPEEFRSAFFKLGKRSYDIEDIRRKLAFERAKAKHEEPASKIA